MPAAIVITGVRQIDRKLKRLPVKVQKKVLRQSIRFGLKIIQEEMKAQVPVDRGLTRQNIKVRALKRRSNRIGMECRVTTAPGLVAHWASGEPFFYPAGIEFGDSEHAPNPFGRRSYQAKGQTARDETMIKMRDGVEREATTS